MRAYKLNNDSTNPPSSASGGYVSFVVHIWVEESGKIIRGTIEDAHTGTWLALDLSEIVAFLQTSLVHSPGQPFSLHDKVDMHGRAEGGLNDVQDDHVQDP